jgi:FMN phosphatase YigB (HAD superfamily)
LLLGQKDSARYWSAIGLKAHKTDNYLRIVSAPDLQHALDIVEEVFVIDNKEDMSNKAWGRFTAYEIFGQYRQATEELIKYNNDFPEDGNYGFLRHPYYDKIKKEYPPFQKAINSLKRKPMPDVSTMIKW